MPRSVRVTTRNASFQQWQALLANRTKRHRAGEFLVQGVRPITLAVEHGWPVSALLHDGTGPLSGWAREVIDRVPDATRVAMDRELLAELGGKSDTAPELVAVVRTPADRLDRISVAPDSLVLVFDRPTAPGNIGTVVRSADAFGAAGVVVTGHAADPYDPKAVRASTGSLFAVPTVRAGGHQEVLDWIDRLRRRGVPLRIVGTDEHGDTDVADEDLTGPVAILIGNETRGLSAAWRDACDRMVRIPMTGAASSLNAATAGSVLLYETARQRRRAVAGPAARSGATRTGSATG
ncbi:TrmH family RNA methyltransferase [Plantactinospora sp. KBS50]|uniref:TrmH family RNA methyltransferase n=1 Tax=Plantactinospora sp. KBS50 TaxID=2024580 RepID=UPI000BAAB229|nr:TrmH family RNA methyltransferase [Plantactinospora sp. KBS50]ASW53503.1 rRNA methyltransferase [Plantactinospora sp. KBS50]